jgi:hypothetical protein
MDGSANGIETGDQTPTIVACGLLKERANLFNIRLGIRSVMRSAPPTRQVREQRDG